MILLISLLCEFKAVTLPRISQEINLSLLQPVNFISKVVRQPYRWLLLFLISQEKR
ncbi:hypothetical protein IC611_07395 [Proteus mirabilis]